VRHVPRAAKSEDWTDVLRDVPLFAGLSKRHVRAIAALGTTRRHAPGTTIVRAGARGDAFHVILDGTVDVRRPGHGALTLGAGGCFGELALLDGAPRTATVEARDDVLTMRFAAGAFRALLEREPKVAMVLLRTLATRLRVSEASSTH
jgi:CRP-like cAMP-binding protein